MTIHGYSDLRKERIEGFKAMTNKIKFEIGIATGTACYNWTPAEYDNGYLFYAEQYELFDIEINGKSVDRITSWFEDILINIAKDDKEDLYG